MIEHQPLTPADLNRLLDADEGDGRPVISAFLPTSRSRAETAQNRRVLQGLLQLAEERLGALGCSRKDARDQLAEALDACAAPEFWAGCQDGLALFVTPDDARAFRVPFPLPEYVVVGPRSHTKPLLPLLDAGDGVWVLALARNSVRLYRADPFTWSEVEIPGIEAVYELEAADLRERQLHSHAGSRQGMSGRPTVAFHGHGDTGTEDPKVREQRFCHAVAKLVEPVLRGAKEPLVLAGVGSMLATYRHANTYKPLVEQGLLGNSERVDLSELHRRALEIVPPFKARRQTSTARYLEAQCVSRTVEFPLAAYEHASAGRLDRVFVAQDAFVWATLEPGGAPCLQANWVPGALDLLDLIAAETLRRGGVAHCVPQAEFPCSSELVAGVLRY